jgi:hypothetical protein
LHNIRLSAVYEGSAEKQAESENAIFGKATPAGQMTMAIAPADVAAFFEPGGKYYLDFTRAPD